MPGPPINENIQSIGGFSWLVVAIFAELELYGHLNDPRPNVFVRPGFTILISARFLLFCVQS